MSADPLEILLVEGPPAPLGYQLLQAIASARGLSETERGKLRRAAAAEIRAAYRAGLELAAGYVERHIVIDVPLMAPAVRDQVLGFGLSAEHDLLAAGIRGLAK